MRERERRLWCKLGRMVLKYEFRSQIKLTESDLHVMRSGVTDATFKRERERERERRERRERERESKRKKERE